MIGHAAYKNRFLSLLIFIFLSGQAIGQEEEPGYVDFDRLDMPPESESLVEILLKPPLLKMISESTREDDPEFADLLTRLKLIHVASFSFAPRDAERINDRVARAAERFDRTHKWDRVVRVRDREESSFISLKMQNDQVVGLLIMVVDKKREVFYINIVGDIDLAQIGRIGRKFNISQLEQIRMPK